MWRCLVSAGRFLLLGAAGGPWLLGGGVAVTVPREEPRQQAPGGEAVPSAHGAGCVCSAHGGLTVHPPEPRFVPRADREAGCALCGAWSQGLVRPGPSPPSSPHPGCVVSQGYGVQGVEHTRGSCLRSVLGPSSFEAGAAPPLASRALCTSIPIGALPACMDSAGQQAACCSLCPEPLPHPEQVPAVILHSVAARQAQGWAYFALVSMLVRMGLRFGLLDPHPVGGTRPETRLGRGHGPT